jgi:hypothetical protein
VPCRRRRQRDQRVVTAFVPPAVSFDRFSSPYTPTGFLLAQFVFTSNHVLLLVGILGLARSGAAGSGLLGRVGLWISLVGMAALTMCEVWAMTFVTSSYLGQARAYSTRHSVWLPSSSGSA